MPPLFNKKGKKGKGKVDAIPEETTAPPSVVVVPEPEPPKSLWKNILTKKSKDGEVVGPDFPKSQPWYKLLTGKRRNKSRHHSISRRATVEDVSDAGYHDPHSLTEGALKLYNEGSLNSHDYGMEQPTREHTLVPGHQSQTIAGYTDYEGRGTVILPPETVDYDHGPRQSMNLLEVDRRDDRSSSGGHSGGHGGTLLVRHGSHASRRLRGSGESSHGHHADAVITEPPYAGDSPVIIPSGIPSGHYDHPSIIHPRDSYRQDSVTGSLRHVSHSRKASLRSSPPSPRIVETPTGTYQEYSGNVILVVDEGVDLQIGNEETGFMPYEEYMASAASKAPPPPREEVFVVHGGKNMVFQDDNGNVIEELKADESGRLVPRSGTYQRNDTTSAISQPGEGDEAQPPLLSQASFEEIQSPTSIGTGKSDPPSGNMEFLGDTSPPSQEREQVEDSEHLTEQIEGDGEEEITPVAETSVAHRFENGYLSLELNDKALTVADDSEDVTKAGTHHLDSSDSHYDSDQENESVHLSVLATPPELGVLPQVQPEFTGSNGDEGDDESSEYFTLDEHAASDVDAQSLSQLLLDRVCAAEVGPCSPRTPTQARSTDKEPTGTNPKETDLTCLFKHAEYNSDQDSNVNDVPPLSRLGSPSTSFGEFETLSVEGSDVGELRQIFGITPQPPHIPIFSSSPESTYRTKELEEYDRTQAPASPLPSSPTFFTPSLSPSPSTNDGRATSPVTSVTSSGSPAPRTPSPEPWHSPTPPPLAHLDGRQSPQSIQTDPSSDFTVTSFASKRPSLPPIHSFIRPEDQYRSSSRPASPTFDRPQTPSYINRLSQLPKPTVPIAVRGASPAIRSLISQLTKELEDGPPPSPTAPTRSYSATGNKVARWDTVPKPSPPRTSPPLPSRNEVDAPVVSSLRSELGKSSRESLFRPADETEQSTSETPVFSGRRHWGAVGPSVALGLVARSAAAHGSLRLP